jgi:hypothetical protein
MGVMKTDPYDPLTGGFHLAFFQPSVSRTASPPQSSFLESMLPTSSGLESYIPNLSSNKIELVTRRTRNENDSIAETFGNDITRALSSLHTCQSLDAASISSTEYCSVPPVTTVPTTSETALHNKRIIDSEMDYSLAKRLKNLHRVGGTEDVVCVGGCQRGVDRMVEAVIIGNTVFEMSNVPFDVYIT